MMTHESLLFISILVIVMALSLSISNTYAITTVTNADYSIDIPDNWAYEEGLFSQVALTPNEFGVLLLNKTKPLNDKMNEEGAYASFEQRWQFGIKNAPSDLYVKYEIDRQTGMNVTSKQNVTFDNQTAVKIHGDGIKSFTGIKFVAYMLMHDKEPYYLTYMANVKDFEKYLPQE